MKVFSLEKAEAAIWEEIEKVKADVSSEELEKIRNQSDIKSRIWSDERSE